MMRSVGLHKRAVTFQRPPATTDVISRILRMFDTHTYALQLRLAVLLMFTTNMRQSNLFPITQRSFDPHRMLLRRDITINPSALVVANKWSKSAQQVSSLRFQTIPCAASPNMCTWTAARRLFDAYPCRSYNQPLFHFNDYKPMTLPFMIKLWKQALSALGLDRSLTLHSLRRGGASYLQQAGVPLPDVAAHGGWRSAAVLRYTRHPSDCTTSQALRDLS